MQIKHKMIASIIAMIIVVGYWGIGQADEVVCIAGCRTEFTGQCNTNSCSPGREFIGYYASSADAIAALDATGAACGGPYYTQIGGSGECPTVSSGAPWYIISKKKQTQSYLGGCPETSCTWSWNVYAYYYSGSDPGSYYDTDSDGDGVGDSTDECPDTAAGASVDGNGCSEAQGDTDGDGISNLLDPYPDNADPFIWKLSVYQQDEQGELTFLCIRTHKGDKKCFGDYNDEEDIYISTDTDWRDSSELEDMAGDNQYTEELVPISESIVADFSPMDTVEFDEGLDNTGNSTDTDYLEDIVNNTKTIGDNQDKIGQYLKEISDDLKKNNELQAQDQDQQVIPFSVNTDAPGADEIADEIKQDVDARDLARDTQGESAASDAMDQINGVDTTLPGEFTEQEKPDEDLISTIFGNWISNNPVAQYINDTSIDTTGAACSFTWEYNGTPVNFTMCNFVDEVNLIGTILLGLSGVSALLIVFKR